MRLLDSHTHLDGFARSGELPDVLARAAAAGVEAMIAIGTAPDDWALYRDLAEQRPGVVHYAVGLHPCSVDAGWRAAVDQLSHIRQWQPAPVAIGETGLDRFHLPKDDPAAAARLLGWQQESFRAHLALAQAWDLPVVVHSRGAAAECIALIDEAGFDWARVVFHCFTESKEIMREVNRRGGRGSFGGVATYKNAEPVRASALQQGIDRLMLETDAPYLTPEPMRGKRNEPAFVAHTAKRLAEVFAMPLEEFAAATTRNAREFFRI